MSDIKQAYFREGTKIEDGSPVTIHVIAPGGALSGTALNRVVLGSPVWDEKILGYTLSLGDDRGNAERWLIYPHKGV